MAPLSRSAILSLLALTLHFSILSITLHISRSTAGPRYKASSAVVLTEALKIIISIGLIFLSGELRPAAQERRRLRWEIELAKRDAGPLYLVSDEQVVELDEKDLLPTSKRTRSSISVVESPLYNGAHTSSLRVNVALAQQPTPSVSIIPPTPTSANSTAAKSATDHSTLHPYRFLSEQTVHHETERGLDLPELLDWDIWMVMRGNVFGKGWWKLAIPAVLFVFQANAQYVASGNLSVPLFQLAYQLKIPATALCSVFLLKRTLSPQQWLSLFVLTFGVGIVQLSIVTPSAPVIMTRLPPPSAILAAAVHSNRIVARAIIEDRPAPNQLLGLTAVIAACLSSGFASTYFERVLKTPSTYRGSTTISPPPSIWIRNIQLSIFGLAAGIPIVFYEMSVSGTGLGKAVAGGNWWEGFSWGATRGSVGFFYGQFFQGFNALTWAVVFLQVTGGLLGALVMQHADNISKCFSTSLSILLSFAASMYLFGFQLTAGVALGSMLVLLSTFVYTQPTTGWKRRFGGGSLGNYMEVRS